MMRLVQNKSFEETVNSAATQQVENKFEYYRWLHKQRRFIMYFDTDLTIKKQINSLKVA
jgi:hypothetical protein